MLKLSSPFSCFAALAFSLLSLCGCGSLADQIASADKPSTPIVAARNTPAFTTALDTYIARDEPAYKWEKISQKKIGKNDVTTLLVTSQTWQGMEWKHRVEIARPDKIEFPGWALLYLSTTDSVIESILAQSLAGKMGATTVHVMGIPNQPLYGKREDALMAHTFSQFIAGEKNSKDDTWPLLLPMTKGAIKVMDAVQEYSSQQKTPLNKFIVTGASKRGWTTWLIGAADTKNRIGGIIPMVYDNLNTAAQLPHQKEVWGDYSSMIADYTRNNLPEKMRTPRGIELTKLIDPYYYRARLTMPKLIVNATNDPYWTTDALNLYWNDLPGPKNVYYAPNVGHTMEGDLENVFGTSAAWFRWVAKHPRLSSPNLKISMSSLDSKGGGFREVKQHNGIYLAASPNRYRIEINNTQEFLPAQVKFIRLWVAHSANRDFRQSHWDSILFPAWNRAGTSVSIPRTPDGKKFSAAYAELTLNESKDRSQMKLSTPIVEWTRDTNNQ